VESVSLKYAVVSVEDKPFFFQVLADALCEVHGINRVDAMRRARNSHYIFEAGLAEDQARRLRDLLTQRDVPSAVVPMTCFVKLGKAVWLAHAACIEESFRIQPMEGKPFSVEWPDITMIGYGHVEHRIQKEPKGGLGPAGDVGAFGIAAGVGLAPGFGFYRHSTMYDRAKHFESVLQQKEEVELHDCLDMFVGSLRDAEFAAHFRVFSNRFCYDYLGGRKQPTSTGNFRCFVEDIAKFAPNLLLTGRTRRFLSGDHGGRPIPGFQTFDEYNCWSVAMSNAPAS